jgi:hypothetical protein
VFRAYDVPVPEVVRGELKFSPLFDVALTNGHAVLNRHYPSPEYEDEYGASRTYLPDVLNVGHDTLAAMEQGRLTEDVLDLMRRRVVVDLPPDYL